MAVEVRVTALLQRVVGGAKTVEAQGTTVSELLDDLEGNYPGFKGQVLAEDGDLHRFVNIYKNDEDIRFLGNLNTALQDGDVISILPALAGGQ
ncbi:MAG: MoaD/ThiS family protein [Dehalococcoidia bacterium]|nr:MoaD/ThiS family protein [Dehalococcoidia bacterium]